MRSPQCVFSLCGSVQRGSELSRDVVTRVNAGRLRAARTDGRAGGRADRRTGAERGGEEGRERNSRSLRPPACQREKLQT